MTTLVEINELLASKKRACQGILALALHQGGLSFSEHTTTHFNIMESREYLINKIEKIDIFLESRLQALTKTLEYQELQNEIESLMAEILKADLLNKTKLLQEMTDNRLKLDQIRSGKKGTNQYLHQGKFNTAGAFTDYRK